LRWWDGTAWTDARSVAEAKQPSGLGSEESDEAPIQAYGTSVTCRNDELVIKGTSLLGRTALGSDRVTVGYDEISSVSFKAANPVINGRLTIETISDSFLVYFRHKQQAQLRRLYEYLRTLEPHEKSEPTAPKK
jgi:hypothetical protein